MIARMVVLCTVQQSRPINGRQQRPLACITRRLVSSQASSSVLWVRSGQPCNLYAEPPMPWQDVTRGRSFKCVFHLFACMRYGTWNSWLCGTMRQRLRLTTWTCPSLDLDAPFDGSSVYDGFGTVLPSFSLLPPFNVGWWPHARTHYTMINYFINHNFINWYRANRCELRIY